MKKGLVFLGILLFALAGVACKKEKKKPIARKATSAPVKRVVKKRPKPRPRKKVVVFEGTYHLDGKKIAEEGKKWITTLSKRKRRFGKFILAIFSKMKMEMTLNKDGSVLAKTTKPSLFRHRRHKRKPKTSISKGTWKKDGAAILVTTIKKRHRHTKKETMHCVKEGTWFTCKAVPKKKKKKNAIPMLYFIKK